VTSPVCLYFKHGVVCNTCASPLIRGACLLLPLLPLLLLLHCPSVHGRWPLDLTVDTNFAGQVPCVAVPSFSQPQPYPLVLLQQATAAQDGGWMVHVFLDPAEADDMQQAVAAQGGL
jgi:hypothetical protein